MAKFTVKIYDTPYTVDEANGSDRIRKACPNFFKGGGLLGKNQRYTFYRGCVIVSMTVQFTGCRPRRKYVAYIYDHDQRDTFCVSADCDPKNIRAAKRIIDKVLAEGRHEYGDNHPKTPRSLGQIFADLSGVPHVEAVSGQVFQPGKPSVE